MGGHASLSAGFQTRGVMGAHTHPHTIRVIKQHLVGTLDLQLPLPSPYRGLDAVALRGEDGTCITRHALVREGGRCAVARAPYPASRLTMGVTRCQNTMINPHGTCWTPRGQLHAWLPGTHAVFAPPGARPPWQQPAPGAPAPFLRVRPACTCHSLSAALQTRLGNGRPVSLACSVLGHLLARSWLRVLSRMRSLEAWLVPVVYGPTLCERTGACQPNACRVGGHTRGARTAACCRMRAS